MKVLCTLEDHALSGGFGSAVAEHLSDAGIATPLVRIGWPDQFIEHGSVAILREKYGMTAKAAAARIVQAFKAGAANNLELKKAGTELR